MSKSKRCDIKKLMSDAPEIVRRLKKTDAILTGLMKEYNCGHAVMMKAVLSQITKSQWMRIRKNKLLRGNMKSRFPKGHVPFNKGLKGIHLSPATEFKKGHLSSNHRHVGSRRLMIRTRKGNTVKFWEIKVSGIMQGQHKWIPYAKYIWEQKNGPVPVGKFIVHIDGDSLNDNIENLRPVTRREHLKLQMVRDPKMIERCRRKCGMAQKKRAAMNRKMKTKSAKREKIEATHKKQIKAGINELRGHIVQWWECIGCGVDFSEATPYSCPKCGGLRFKKISQRVAC